MLYSDCVLLAACPWTAFPLGLETPRLSLAEAQRKKDAFFMANDQEREAGTSCPFICGERVVYLWVI